MKDINNSKKKKTIFIIITRSLITRNILRFGTLDLLKQSGYKIIIFFNGDEIPRHLREEFEEPDVVLHTLHTRRNRWHGKFNLLKRYLIFTKNSKLYIHFTYRNREKNIYKLSSGIQSWKGKPRGQFLIQYAFGFIVSKIPFFKAVFRFLEAHVLTDRDKHVQDFFNHYHPDLVFSTSINGVELHAAFLKEAKQRRIPTLGMPKSWDNATTEYYAFVPDYFVAQNEIIANIANRIQKIPRDRISVCGLPQFDWYVKTELHLSRDEHFKKKGLDSNRALIFFGSEGAWALNDFKIAELIYSWIEKNELAKPCQLLVRPHYSNVKSDIFKQLRGKPHVVVDDYRIVDFMADKWDLSTDEIIDFTNSILHCDVMVNPASSLSLDAACVDRPVVNVAFGCEYIDGKDVSLEKLYLSSDHMGWLLATKGTDLACSPEELKEALNQNLENPQHNKDGRERIRNQLCYKVDGRASERLVQTIDDIISGTNA